jgi:hypothetical protein
VETETQKKKTSVARTPPDGVVIDRATTSSESGGGGKSELVGERDNSVQGDAVKKAVTVYLEQKNLRGELHIRITSDKI